jgi:SAM-dependent methyltransferase
MEENIKRVVPWDPQPELVSEHVARYRFAAELTVGRQVLDLGCGVGYGAEIFTHAGATSVAVDIAADAVAAEKARYEAPEIRFMVADCRELPLQRSSVDCAVAFEVLEHVENSEDLLREAHRVLRSDELLIVSTPNRLTYNEHRPEEPNLFHVRELDRNEFRGLLANTFDGIAVYDQVFAEGVLIQPEGPRQGAPPELPSHALPSPAAWQMDEPDYYLAVCWKRSRQPRALDVLGGVFFLSPTEFLRRLRCELRSRQIDLDEKRAWALKLDKELMRKEKELLYLRQGKESAWLGEFEAELEQRDRKILELQSALAEMAQRATEDDARRQRLEEEISRLTEALGRHKPTQNFDSGNAPT